MNQITLITLTAMLMICPAASAHQYGSTNKHNGSATCQDSSRNRPFQNLRDEFRQEIQSFKKEQQEKRKAFTQTLTDLTPEERYNAMKNYAQEQHTTRLSFREDLYKEFYQKVSNKLEGNDRLTLDQKLNILAKIKNNHQKRILAFKEKFEKNQSYVEGVWNNTALSLEEKRREVKNYFKSQGEERQSNRKTQRENRKKKFQEFRQNYQDQNHGA